MTSRLGMTTDDRDSSWGAVVVRAPAFPKNLPDGSAIAGLGEVLESSFATLRSLLRGLDPAGGESGSERDDDVSMSARGS